MCIRALIHLFTVYILSMTTGCVWLGVKMYKPEYDFTLSEVQVSEGNGSPTTYTALLQTQQKSLIFTDEWLLWDWTVHSQGQLQVKIKSSAAEPITLRWDLARLKLMDENVYRLVDLDIKYADRKQSKPPVQLKPGSTRKESIYPADFLYSDPFIPQLPGIATTHLDKADEFGQRQLGTRFTIILPVEGFAKMREYTFVMVITDYHIKEIIGQ